MSAEREPLDGPRAADPGAADPGVADPGAGDGGGARGALIALLVIVLLVAGVAVLVNRIGAASKMQDCVQSGRTNCAPVHAD